MGENEFLIVLFPFVTDLIEFDGDDVYLTPLNTVEFDKNSFTECPSS